MKDLQKLLLECIDLEKLALGLVKGIGEKALVEAAAKSETKIDDAVLAMLLPALDPVIEEFIKKEVADLKAKIA